MSLFTNHSSCSVWLAWWGCATKTKTYSFLTSLRGRATRSDLLQYYSGFYRLLSHLGTYLGEQLSWCRRLHIRALGSCLSVFASVLQVDVADIHVLTGHSPAADEPNCHGCSWGPLYVLEAHLADFHLGGHLQWTEEDCESHLVCSLNESTKW